MKTFFCSLVLFTVVLICSSTVCAQFILYNTSNSNLVTNACSRIAVDCNGKPWIGHPASGASVMDSAGSFINYKASNSPLAGQFVSFILRDGNRLWMNEFYNGLFLNVDKVWGFIPWYEGSAYGPSVYTAYGMYKRGNDLWVGTKEAGIIRYDVTTTKFTGYDIYNSLPTNYILRITGDTLGNIYAGTGFQGALKFNGSGWTNYTMSNSSLPSNDVYCVACDIYGNVWWGTKHGIAKMPATGAWTVYDSATSGLPGNYIRTIVARGSKLVVATGYGGLGILDIVSNVWTVFNSANSNLPVNTVFDAAVSDSGDVWITLANQGIAELQGYFPWGFKKPVNETRLNVFPNPCDRILNVEIYSETNETLSIDLYSSEGKIVLQYKTGTVHGLIKKTLNVGGLTPGFYFLRLHGNNTVAVRKVIVE